MRKSYLWHWSYHQLLFCRILQPGSTPAQRKNIFPRKAQREMTGNFTVLSRYLLSDRYIAMRSCTQRVAYHIHVCAIG
jgi:hypothetical protein